MNTTDNKTSLYDLVQKSDRMNIVGVINKGSLDSVPRGKFLTILDKFGEVVAIFIHAGIVNGSGFLNPLIAYYDGIGWIKECPSFKIDEIDIIRFSTQTEIEILLKNMKKEGYIWNGWDVIKDEDSEEKEDETPNESSMEEEYKINNDNKINLTTLKTLSKGEILTVYNKIGQIEDILIYDCMLNEYGLFNAVLAYSPISGILRNSPVLDFDNLDILAFATPEERENLFKKMKEEGYQNYWNVWDSDDEETEEEELDEDDIIDESPTVEQPSTNGDNIILRREKKLSVKNNMKIARDILDNVLPYYVVNDKMERLVRTTDESLNRDFNNFNYFTNKEDVDEAIRRVKETLMNFQEEIQNRK